MNVTIADLGIGNLHSLGKALERCGATVRVTPEPDAWLDATTLVLPGVGAFGAGMRSLAPVRDALRSKLMSGCPALGVCLGLQLLFERSEETPDAHGLAFIRGGVHRFPRGAHKVPHMGWSRVDHKPEPLFDGVPADAYYYFVHSYYPDPQEPVHVGTTTYGGVRFASVLRKGNTTAAQFHPEKSGPHGLRFLKNWLAQAEAVA